MTSHYHISSWIKFTFKFSQPSLEKLKNIYQFILFSPSSATHSILQRNKLINSTIFFSLNFWRHIISIASFVIKFTFKLSQPSLEKLKNIYQFILFSPSSATHSISQRNKLINPNYFFSLNCQSLTMPKRSKTLTTRPLGPHCNNGSLIAEIKSAIFYLFIPIRGQESLTSFDRFLATFPTRITRCSLPRETREHWKF